MFLAAKNVLLTRGAASVGAVSIGALQPFMSEEAVFKTARFTSVLTATFPYHADGADGNLSRYCRGLDYHRVIGRILKETAAAMAKAEPEAEFLCLVDGSLFPEVLAANLAGAALVGMHGLAIVPPFGSYVFVGCILSDARLPHADEPAGACHGCGACVRACPTGALSAEGPLFYRRARCLSHITQERSISAEKAALLKGSRLVFGCDICQEACPENQSPARTTIPEFLGGNLLPSLRREDIAHLSERAFRRAYRDRAFSFRGLLPILRNFDYLPPEHR